MLFRSNLLRVMDGSHCFIITRDPVDAMVLERLQLPGIVSDHISLHGGKTVSASAATVRSVASRGAPYPSAKEPPTIIDGALLDDFDGVGWTRPLSPARPATFPWRGVADAEALP